MFVAGGAIFFHFDLRAVLHCDAHLTIVADFVADECTLGAGTVHEHPHRVVVADIVAGHNCLAAILTHDAIHPVCFDLTAFNRQIPSVARK